MIVIVIPAKGASSRLANKNMVVLNGRPMIDHTIDAARASRRAEAIYISTDSEAIAAHAEAHGIGVIRRPESLGGEVPLLDVYRHALAELDDPKISVLVGFQPDHPDRDISVDEAIEVFEVEGADRLMSTQADGVKNGAHYVLSRHYLETGESRKDVTLVDDCTNIHYPADLERAAARLAARKA